MRNILLAIPCIWGILLFSGCPAPSTDPVEEARNALASSFATLDLDDDGALTFNEAVEGYKTLTLDVFTELDMNADGILAASELTEEIPSDCMVTLETGQLNAGNAGGTYQVAVNADCSWEAVCDASWVGFGNDGWGEGPGTLEVHILNNDGPQRSAEVHMENATLLISQAGGCTYAIDTTARAFPANGGFAEWILTAGAGCPWTAREYVGWMTPLTPLEGSGSATLRFEIAENTGVERQAIVEIAGERITVVQESGCAVILDEPLVHFDALGGVMRIGAVTPRICDWVARSNANWIEAGGSVGTSGNGWVDIAVDENKGDARTGTVSLGQTTLTVEQESGCVIEILPVGMDIAWEGGTGSFEIETEASCSWAVTTQDTWIVLDAPNSGVGGGQISFQVADNEGPQRRGAITVGANTFSIVQQSNCYADVSPSEVNFVNGQGFGMLHVASPYFCAWETVADVDWIRFHESAEGTGTTTRLYQVLPDDETAQGIVTVGDSLAVIRRDNPSVDQYAASLSTTPSQYFSVGAPCTIQILIEAPSNELNDFILTAQFPEDWVLENVECLFPPDRVFDNIGDNTLALYWEELPAEAFSVNLDATPPDDSENDTFFTATLSSRKDSEVYYRAILKELLLLESGTGGIDIPQTVPGEAYIPGARMDVTQTIAGNRIIEDFTLHEIIPEGWEFEFVLDEKNDFIVYPAADLRSFDIATTHPVTPPINIKYRVKSPSSYHGDAEFICDMLYFDTRGRRYLIPPQRTVFQEKTNFDPCYLPADACPNKKGLTPIVWASWSIMDKNGDNFISWLESYWLHPVNDDIDVMFYWLDLDHSNALHLSEVQAAAWAYPYGETYIDPDADGIVRFQDLISLLTYEEFQMLDSDGNGVLDCGDLQQDCTCN